MVLGALGGAARVGILISAVSNVAGILNRDAKAADGSRSAWNRLTGMLSKVTIGYLLLGKAQALVVAGLAAITATAAGAAFQRFAEAAQRARLQLRILGLEMEDIGFEMIRVEGILGRQLATQIFRSAEAVAFLGSASRDVIDQALLLSKELAAFGDIDPTEFFIAAMEAIQNGDFDLLNRMFPGANIESAEDLHEFFARSFQAVEDVDLTVWDKIRERNREIGDIISGWVGFFSSFAQTGVLSVLNTVLFIIRIIDFWLRTWQLLFQATGELLHGILTGTIEFSRELQEQFRQHFENFLNIFGPFEDEVKRFLVTIVRIAREGANAIKDFFIGAGEAVLQFFRDFVDPRIGPLEALRRLGIRIGELGAEAWDRFRAPWSGISNWFMTWVFRPVQLIVEGVVGLFNWMKDTILSSWGFLRDAVRDILRWIEDRIADIRRLIDRLPEVPELPRSIIPGVEEGLPIPFLDSGGIVPGRRGEPRLVVAHAGETVLPTHKGPVMSGGGGQTRVVLLTIDERVLGEVAFDQFERNVRLKSGITTGRDARG